MPGSTKDKIVVITERVAESERLCGYAPGAACVSWLLGARGLDRLHELARRIAEAVAVAYAQTT